MGDEMEGPYKVVGRLVISPREPQRYMIVKQEKNDVFLREIVPDAGTGETARQLCNLLNKNHKMLQDNAATYAGEVGYDPAN